MKTWALLFLASGALSAANLVPIVCAQDGIGIGCSGFSGPGQALAFLGLDLSTGPIESGPEAITIRRTATVNFSAPGGWVVTGITAFGDFEDNGFDVAVGGGFVGACGAGFFENSNNRSASCGVNNITSGTLRAEIDLFASVTPSGQQPSFGIAEISQFQFSLDPVPIPEPALEPVVLIVLLAGGQRLRYRRASSRRHSNAAIVSR